MRGSIGGQLAQDGKWKYSVHRHHTQFINGGWPVGWNHVFPLFWEFELSLFFFFFGGGDFKLFCEFGVFLGSSVKFPKTTSSMLCNHCSGTGYAIGHQVVRKKNIAFCLFCVFINTMISMNISIFVCCFIKLSLCQPTSFAFSPFCSSSHWEGRERVSKQLSGPSCRLLG